MSYRAIGAATIASGVTAVDCQKQVRSWRLIRSLLELLIPSCNCAFIEDPDTKQQNHLKRLKYFQPQKPILISPSGIFTGTIFGFRRGKVSLCIQTNPNSIDPVLLLEFAIPTSTLAREMQGGTLRITLESSARGCNCNDSKFLLSMPVWVMYCNGRRVGYAIKRTPTKGDLDALKVMSSVDVGAGVIGGKKIGRDDDDLMYLRANFSRVRGSADSESFHLIDPDGNIGQELSIFFFRSR